MEVRKMSGLIIPRRKFLHGTATLLTATFAGPAIVKASSLMDIHSSQNRLVVAFRGHHGGLNNESWQKSLLNAGDWVNGDLDLWAGSHSYNEYTLIRAAEVDTRYFESAVRYKELHVSNSELERIRDHRDYYSGRGHLILPSHLRLPE